MKMKKVLAAGVAATLAVTSLAAVVSADNIVKSIVDATGNTRTFDMERTYGKFSLTENISNDKYANGLDLGDKYYLTDDEWNSGERLVNVSSSALLNNESVQKAYAALLEAIADTDDVDAAQAAYDKALADAEEEYKSDLAYAKQILLDAQVKLNEANSKVESFDALAADDLETEVEDYFTEKKITKVTLSDLNDALEDCKAQTSTLQTDIGTKLIAQRAAEKAVSDYEAEHEGDLDPTKDPYKKLLADATAAEEAYNKAEADYTANETLITAIETSIDAVEDDVDYIALVDDRDVALASYEAADDAVQEIEYTYTEITKKAIEAKEGAALTTAKTAYDKAVEEANAAYEKAVDSAGATGVFQPVISTTKPAGYAGSYTITVPEELWDAFKGSGYTAAKHSAKDTSIWKNALSLKITGVKGTRTASAQEYEYPFVFSGYDANLNPIFALDVYSGVAPSNGFLPEQFLEITKLSLGKSSDFAVYGFTDSSDSDVWHSTVGIDKDIYDLIGASSISAANLATLQSVTGLSNQSGVWKSAKLTVSGISETYGAIFGEITKLLNDVNGGWYAYNNDKTTYNEYAFLPQTTATVGADIRRNNVITLSETGGWSSQTAWVYSYELDNITNSDYNGSNFWYSEDGTTKIATTSGQSYHDGTYFGTLPNAFAGLASQAADFFNKYYTGSITFNLALPSSSSSTNDWKYGGVPSTEVGIKSMLSTASTNDFALFFNYGSTTGSLQAATKIDATNGQVIFDISDILDALDGRTIGTVQDIWYGLNQYTSKYNSTIPGIFVSSIEFNRGDSDVAADVDEVEDDTDVVEPETDDTADDIEADDEVAVPEADDEDDFVDEDDDEDDFVDEDDDEDDFADDEDGFVDEDDDIFDDSIDDIFDDSLDDDSLDDDIFDDSIDDIFDDSLDDDYFDDSIDDAFIDDTTDDTVGGDDITPEITPVIINNDPVGADENPGTGVALAVVPAALAAAAMFISKKRK